MRTAIFLSSLLLLAGCASNEPAAPSLASGNTLPAQSAVLHLSQQLANELVRQNDQLTPKHPLLVTTPVLLDSLNGTNPLGLQLQQGLIAAMHDHQFNLVDLNVAQSVRVTDSGDFILSRDWRKLGDDLPVEHVLVSTMNLSLDELVVNSRIVNVTNNRVVSVASASVTLAELPGYLRASERVEAKQGLLIRHSTQGQGNMQMVGEMQ